MDNDLKHDIPNDWLGKGAVIIVWTLLLSFFGLIIEDSREKRDAMAALANRLAALEARVLVVEKTCNQVKATQDGAKYVNTE